MRTLYVVNDCDVIDAHVAAYGYLNGCCQVRRFYCILYSCMFHCLLSDAQVRSEYLPINLKRRTLKV